MQVPINNGNVCKSSQIKRNVILFQLKFKKKESNGIEDLMDYDLIKRCSKCESVHSENFFPRDKGSKDGKSFICEKSKKI